MLNNKLATISTRPESGSTEQAIREWLVKLAEIHRKNGAPYPLTAVMTAVWVDSLGDLDADVLDAACRKLAQVGCRRDFPIPADVRTHIDRANANGLQLEAEEAWHQALGYAETSYHPDLGISRHAPKLPAVVEHAIAAAGGLRWLEGCPESELQWARKRFVEAYTNIHQLGHVEHLLSDGEAKRLWRKLNSPAKGPQALPAAGDSAGQKSECRTAPPAGLKSQNFGKTLGEDKKN